MRRATTFFAVLCAAVVMWGCPPQTPEEKVAAARARYTVTLNGFFAKEPAPEPAMEEAAAEAAVAAVAAEAAVAEGGEAEEGEEGPADELAGPRGVDVLLDLIVQHDLDKALPGITVDLQMVDANRDEKASWRVWIDTDGLPKANLKQVTHLLEGIEYEEGDAFAVELRSSIPPEEYGDYREFAEAAP